MAFLQPVYTPENCKVAYQLDWSYSLFWNSSPGTQSWLPELKSILESDGIRILNHRFTTEASSLFLVSTRPEVLPIMIPQRIKGRLQHIVRNQHPQAFQRNYDLRSVGSTHRDKIEAYLASQLAHHSKSGKSQSADLADLQAIRPEVNLAQEIYTAHARHICNLHLVFVNDYRWCEVQIQKLEKVRAVILLASESKGHRLSRLSVLPDHIHLTIGYGLDESPLQIALSYMNNIAWVYDLQPVLMSSCYIAGFGEYDLGAIKLKKPV
ncbi:MAG: hypothetical protein JWM11_4424 [Planctomycetaceae bacterium]|nr:hypothetical protein [Planctomycetaceae bacterium]